MRNQFLLLLLVAGVNTACITIETKVVVEKMVVNNDLGLSAQLNEVGRNEKKKPDPQKVTEVDNVELSSDAEWEEIYTELERSDTNGGKKTQQAKTSTAVAHVEDEVTAFLEAPTGEEVPRELQLP